MKQTQLHPISIVPARGPVVGYACLILLLTFAGCEQKEPAKPGEAPAPPAAASRPDALAGGPFPTLLVSQAQFVWETGADGKRTPKPGDAVLMIVRKTPEGWQTTSLEDPESRVFHGAVPVAWKGEPAGFLTLGGTDAVLRQWHHADGRWHQKTLWRPNFGGTWSRLRDLAIGDVTGDGADDLVLATHDQGVVAVLQRAETGWSVTELDRKPRVFVHEVEIADIDGDGRNEFFATPSEPNQATGLSQPGHIMMYRHDGTAFHGTVVDEPKGTHVKEIMAVDARGGGRPSLFAAVEARMELRDGKPVMVNPVEIREYRWEDGGFSARVVATLPDRQCRFLSPGDVDGDGKTDIVATGAESGVWVLRQEETGAWTADRIDAESSGFEHAALVADLEGDGKYEIYVASDPQQELRRYEWNGDRFERQAVVKIPEDRITFSLAAGRF